MARPRALLLSLDSDHRELEELLYSLGYDLAAAVVQRRGRPDPTTFLGAGKVEEVQHLLERANGRAGPRIARAGAGEALQRAERRGIVGAAEGPEPAAGGNARAPAGAGISDAAAQPIALVAVNAHLKPSQVAELERRFAVDVFDRVRVILEIFQQRAHTREARLQVELARLRYERPLVREYIHLAKRGEHPGFMAGGEYAVDVYYNTINGRIKRIQEDLARIGQERELRRQHRRRGGFQLVSLAGYANAGKSSLLRRMSGEEVLVENRMFSTLETRTGRATSRRRNLLVTDTVGFVDGLPPDLVAAFRSTLEEIAHADCIVLVVDGSDEPAEVARKLGTSARVLRDFEDLAPIVVALNKSDAVPPASREPVEREVRSSGLASEGDALWVSALRGDGLDALEQRVLAHLQPLLLARAVLPLTDTGERLLGAIYEDGIVDAVARDGELRVDFRATAAWLGSFGARVRAAGGTMDRVEG